MPLILHNPHNPLSNLQSLLATQIPFFTSLSHSFNRPHPPILFHPLPVLNNEFPWSLNSPRQHTPTHNTTSSQQQSLRHMPNRPDSPISNNRNIKLLSILTYMINSSSLSPPTSTNLLSSANRSTTHSHSKPINPRINQHLSLLSSHHISSNNIEFLLRFQPF